MLGAAYRQPTSFKTGTMMLRAPQARQRMIQSPASGSGDVVSGLPQWMQL